MKWIPFKPNNFIQQELIKAGTVLKMKNGEIEIVGDVSSQLGYCDCCKANTIAYFTNDFADKFEAIRNEATLLKE